MNDIFSQNIHVHKVMSHTILVQNNSKNKNICTKSSRNKLNNMFTQLSTHENKFTCR